MQDDVVIVGGGQAALSCAVRLREAGYSGPVTIVGDEPWLPYQRPPLSKAYLLGQTTADRLQFRPREFYEKVGIDLQVGQRVIKINPAERLVTLENGKNIPFGKLVLATGSRARALPETMTRGLDGVFTLRGVTDADHLCEALVAAKHILVIGGGYVGLEVASIAARMGKKVTVIEMAGRVLNRVAGVPTALAVSELHRRNGVNLVTNATLQGFLNDGGRVAGVSLTNGTKVEADMVLVAIGGVANAEVAADAGLVAANGIMVDGFCQTSAPDIYAAGDCAVFPFYGRSIRLESVQNAVEQGVAVANSILGKPVSYDPVPWFWSDQYDTKLQTAGLPLEYDEIVSLGSGEGSGSAFWYFRDGFAVAVDTMNDAKTHMAARRIFGARVKLQRELLLEPEFDLLQYARVAGAASS
ncbi:FAD-dependent oxidoreductase [Mesorhizobium sp. Cs1299R1N1]|uniref:NAD(P)/FAD-dependent oxidoreductase n=1 Tax=unclassified Mesorhizobium TaxID=325217 RepID=UPI00301D057E